HRRVEGADRRAVRRDDRRLRDRFVQAGPPPLVGVLRAHPRRPGPARPRRRQPLPRRRADERAGSEERLGEPAPRGRRSCADQGDRRPERPGGRVGRARPGVKAPAGFTSRAATGDDAAAAAELMNAFDRAYLPEPDTMTADEVAGWWEQLDLERD